MLLWGRQAVQVVLCGAIRKGDDGGILGWDGIKAGAVAGHEVSSAAGVGDA